MTETAARRQGGDPGRQVSPRLRVAFVVADSPTKTEQLLAAGATLVASPT